MMRSRLGACILQDNKPVSYASRSLCPAEENYANIERELLAIVYSCERFHQYTYGRQVVVHSDHKPLESIINKPLSKAPPRLQRLLLRLQRYTLRVKWVPGKDMRLADALSRAPLLDKSPVLSTDEEEEVGIMVHSIIDSLPLPSNRLEELKHLSHKDPMFRQLMYYCQFGWPSRKKTPSEMIPYWEIRDDIHIYNELLMFRDKLLIPESWRKTILDRLHI